MEETEILKLIHKDQNWHSWKCHCSCKIPANAKVGEASILPTDRYATF